MSNVKGNALGGFKNFVAAQHGAAGVERWLEGLSPQEAAQVGGIILPHGWYPVGLWNRLTDRYMTLFGDGHPQCFRPVASAIAEEDLHRFFTVLLKAASPATVLRRSASLWERYFDEGTMEASEVAPKRFTVRLTASRLPDRGPGPITCSVGIPVWQERLMSHMGAREGRCLHTRCRFRGAKACEFDVSWG
ncbi:MULTISPECIES: hypothetical protein [Sorangium]|uniref:4-vinyl reductase 4VR domain-containing protein n=1 Tax=Sorangium cellulosum TaxID=56 RepID=A0A4P2QHE3_SORCE|nr:MULTISPECIES: hypothetical protein [Sorangium]AUX29397.1 hypothetical protein SOCE836_014870 [Sorangium cellulosum]WCQ88792.1 hypothetical protein NQZ70_01474 [Sorangium sp. Soce836]